MGHLLFSGDWTFSSAFAVMGSGDLQTRIWNALLNICPLAAEQQKCDCRPAGPQAEMCNRRKSVYCVNRDECSALQYCGVLHHKNLFMLGHILSKAIALVSETGRNWCTAIKGKAKYWNEVGKKLSKYVCSSSSHGMGALQNFFSVEERKKKSNKNLFQISIIPSVLNSEY